MRHRMVAPINSIKHYVQIGLGSVGAASATAHLIAQGIEAVSTTPTQVRAGAVVKAVYIEMWIKASAEAVANVLVTFVKTVDLQTPTITDMGTLHDYTNKKNVLYHTQGLVNDSNADAIPFVRGWFKVPKGKQRIGLGDSLFLVVTAQGPAVDECGFFVYKEYT